MQSEQSTKQDTRNETEAERLDRNFSELLQELRIAQTGIQILFAFLLGIAFQQRFTSTDTTQRGIYIAALLCTAMATACLIAPVALHRILFRQRRKDEVVETTNRLAMAGLCFLLLSVLCGVLLILDVLLSFAAAVGVTSALAVVFVFLWIVMPLRYRMHGKDDG
jgi:putative flippase GtrA